MDKLPRFGDLLGYDAETDYPRPPSPSSGQYEGEEEEIDTGEVEVDVEPVKLTLWQEILQEYNDARDRYHAFKDRTQFDVVVPSDYDRASAYTYREIFPTLLPALEACLIKAREWDCLRIQKCRFSGLDFIAEYLWNRNPHHQRGDPWLNIYEVPFAEQWLKEHPRPLFPMSWLWTPEEAALIIQRVVRGYLVRRRDDVQEMRQFWKTLTKEQQELEEQKNQGEQRLRALETVSSEQVDEMNSGDTMHEMFSRGSYLSDEEESWY